MENDFSNASAQEIDDFHKRISSKIRFMRESRGLSQLELALEIGIKSVAFYSNCECNRYGKHFNLEHIYKIAKAFGVSEYELLK